MLTEEQIEEHFKTWKAQASKVLNFDTIEIRRNGDWLDKLTFPQIVKLLATTTVQQLLERDMFQERIKKGLPIFTHELIYPLLQGYDSVVMDVDLEIGGNDQTFNMLVGRHLQEVMNHRDKFVLSCKLLVGSDGNKMGKSLGNFISLTETPENMFGKLMSIVDAVIPEYFELLTDVPSAEIVTIRKQLADGSVNPMELKKKLAFTITAMFNGEATAKHAHEFFEKTVQNKEVPEDVYTVFQTDNDPTLLEFISVISGMCKSNSDARRLIEQGAVEVDGKKVYDPKYILRVVKQPKIKVGKRNFLGLKAK